MPARWRHLGPAGLGAGLALSFPPVVLAQVLSALNDREDLPGIVVVLLATIVVVGPLVAGVVVGRRRPRWHPLLAALVGAATLAIVGSFGYLLLRAADEDPEAAVVPQSAAVGAAFALVGDGMARARAGRTRR